MISSDDCGAEQARILIRACPDLLRMILLLTAMVFSLAVAAEPDKDSLIATGRRIYQDGVLPDGELLQAVRPESFVMEGEHAACVTCHRRSGMGSVEGNVDSTVLVPPVSGPVLFATARFATTYLNPLHHYVPTDAWNRAMTRPAYDQKSLARALREGLDPGGEQLRAPMPRYDLNDDSLEALGAYLEQLTSSASPGVEADTLHVASVITDEVSDAQADAVLGVVRAWTRSAHGAGRQWQLHVWVLSGPPASWPAQLESYYREQPVFALLSGAGAAEWAPVHSFCERTHLPCVLPSLEVAPDPAGDWYSMYFSPGVGLEARVLARFLNDADDSRSGHANIVQVYSDASGRHAAEVLQAKLDSVSGKVSRRRFRVTSPRAALNDISARDILVLWLRPDELSQLANEMPQGPPAGRVFVSALLATPGALELTPAWKARLHFVSLFDDAGLQGDIARLRLERWLEQNGLAGKGDRRIQADAYAACYLFNDALADILEQEVRRPPVPLSREHMLEMLESLVNKYNDSTDLVDPDSHVAYYGRMSLGPRQRVAVHGGTIMRYSSPGSNDLVPVGRRIVP